MFNLNRSKLIQSYCFVLFLIYVQVHSQSTILSTSEIFITEGASASYTIVLQSQPDDAVSIDISSSNENQITIDKSSIEFSVLNWDNPQIVTLTAVQNDIHESTEQGIAISHTGGNKIMVNVYDDTDEPGVIIDTSILSIAEGGISKSYEITLSR